jgi:alpha-L-fucosidase
MGKNRRGGPVQFWYQQRHRCDRVQEWYDHHPDLGRRREQERKLVRQLYPFLGLVGRLPLFSLLNVGPTAEGEIIAPMADNLLAAGRWLKYAGDCVYATVRIVYVCDETRVLKTDCYRIIGTKRRRILQGRTDS